MSPWTSEPFPYCPQTHLYHPQLLNLFSDVPAWDTTLAAHTITWEFQKITQAWAPPQTIWVRISGGWDPGNGMFTSPPWWFRCAARVESHCQLKPGFPCSPLQSDCLNAHNPLPIKLETRRVILFLIATSKFISHWSLKASSFQPHIIRPHHS